MNADSIFELANTSVLIPWLLLIILPRWRWTQYLVIAGGFSILLGALYVMLFLQQSSDFDFSNFGSLKGVTQLFSDPNLVLIGWIHYLAFDLFVGAWEVNNAQKIGISHWLVIPCLIFTFMLGPTGLVIYFIIKIIFKGRKAYVTY